MNHDGSWISYPGEGPKELQGVLRTCEAATWRGCIASQAELVVRCLCCPEDQSRNFSIWLDFREPTEMGMRMGFRNLFLSQIRAICISCGREIPLVVPQRRGEPPPGITRPFRCAACDDERFTVAVALEYPCMREGADGADVDWNAEGIDDDAWSWLYVLGRCDRCGDTAQVGDVEGD